MEQNFVTGYCQNCGNGIEFDASQLLSVEARAIDCPHCGKRTWISKPSEPALGETDKRILPTIAEWPSEPALGETDKRILPAMILCWLLGYIGVHAFYAGRSQQGIFYVLAFIIAVILFDAIEPPLNVFALLLALLPSSIFLLGDFIRIVTGAYMDGDNRKITKWT
jgi:TM2 domain-containing membrane protein YozV/DNA-directed RNA polymerase subunit RPC12/RpoP